MHLKQECQEAPTPASKNEGHILPSPAAVSLSHCMASLQSVFFVDAAHKKNQQLHIKQQSKPALTPTAPCALVECVLVNCYMLGWDFRNSFWGVLVGGQRRRVLAAFLLFSHIFTWIKAPCLSGTTHRSLYNWWLLGAVPTTPSRARGC